MKCKEGALMKTGLCKQFIVLSLLFSFGIVAGALTAPSLTDLTDKESNNEKSQPTKSTRTDKKRLAVNSDFSLNNDY